MNTGNQGIIGEAEEIRLKVRNLLLIGTPWQELEWKCIREVKGILVKHRVILHLKLEIVKMENF